VYENKDIATFDIPGAYLHAPMPDEKIVQLKLHEYFVDIIVKINPEYGKYVRFENGRKVLYLRVIGAIYAEEDGAARVEVEGGGSCGHAPGEGGVGDVDSVEFVVSEEEGGGECSDGASEEGKDKIDCAALLVFGV